MKMVEAIVTAQSLKLNLFVCKGVFTKRCFRLNIKLKNMLKIFNILMFNKPKREKKTNSLYYNIYCVLSFYIGNHSHCMGQYDPV